MKITPETQDRLDALVRVLDRYSGRYRERTGKKSIADYLAARGGTDDEEILTEPVLSDLLQDLLGFPVGGFFPQLSKSGLKPDFTPTDLVAHQFVFDAKSSAITDLDAHEPQIRAYIDQRGLRFGVLFNLRELRVYRRGRRGHDAELSFQLLPLWQVARGEAIPIGEVERFEAFLVQFSHRALGVEDRIQMIRRADPWRVKEALAEQPAIDVEYLVDRLRALSGVLDEDVAAQEHSLDRELRFKASLEADLVAELRTLAADVEPGIDDDRLPGTVAGFRSGDGTAGRAWRQYRLRVAQLALTRILLYRSWEDAGFVDERLYDGGFGRLYDEVDHRVSEVLAAAFGAGRERYEWLYGGASTYDWYLTEVNLLLQVSRLLGRLRELGRPLHDFTLGVVHADTLATRRGPDESFEHLEPGERADRGALEDPRFGLVPLDRAKAEPYRRMMEPEAFELVVGNPPYVFESGNKALFDRLRALPGWKDTYRGKGDYLYYFLMLAAERLAPGGRLAVITPAGWMNAGAADLLRERLASSLRLDELFLFGSYRVFAPEQQDVRDRRRAQSPTVESLILIATKGAAASGHRMRVAILEDERAAALALHPGEGVRVPERDALLTEMARRADAARGGRRAGIFVHSVPQAALRHSEPWPVKFGEKDLPARVVAHLDRQLSDADISPLGEDWHIFQGVQTGADAYSARIQKRMGQEDRDALAAAGRRTGEPILELPPGAETRAPWDENTTLLARSVEPHAILYGALDERNYTCLVWIGRDDEVPTEVETALEPWRRVLATRAEFARNSKRRWFETAWTRDKKQLRAPKVIALYRTDRGRFAVDESGKWQPSIKTTLCTAKSDGLSVAYLAGLLNSELLDLLVRGAWQDASRRLAELRAEAHGTHPLPGGRFGRRANRARFGSRQRRTLRPARSV